MTAVSWAAVASAVLLLLGLMHLLAGRSLRRHRGLGGGKTVSLDRVTLISHRYGLVGRPDRLIRQGGMVWPEEWKSSRQVRPWHHAQLGVYFLLIEDQLGMKPPHGFVVCSDSTRHKIENSPELRAWVLGIAVQIRQGRNSADEPIIVHSHRGQCRPCGVHGHCGQARL